MPCSDSSEIQRLGSQFQFFMAMYQERLTWIRLEGNVSHGALAVSWDGPTPGLVFLSATDQSSVNAPRNLSSISSVSSETQRKMLQSLNPALCSAKSHTSPRELSSGAVYPIQGKGGCMPLRMLTSINCGFCCRCSSNS